MTELQTIMLRRLRLEFGVDTTPAQGLEGAALEAWIEAAEDALFERLVSKPTTTGDQRSKAAAALMAFARKETTTAELEASTKQLNAETRSLQSGLKPAKKRGTP